MPKFDISTHVILWHNINFEPRIYGSKQIWTVAGGFNSMPPVRHLQGNQ